MLHADTYSHFHLSLSAFLIQAKFFRELIAENDWSFAFPQITHNINIFVISNLKEFFVDQKSLRENIKIGTVHEIIFPII